MWEHWVSGTPALHCASPRFVPLCESWISEQRFLVVFFPKTPTDFFPWHLLLPYKCTERHYMNWEANCALRLSSGLVEVFVLLGCYAVYQTKRVENSPVPRRNLELYGRPLFNCFVAWNYSSYQYSNNNHSFHMSSTSHNCSIVLKQIYDVLWTNTLK